MNPLELIGISSGGDFMSGLSGLIDTGLNIFGADQAAKNAKWQKDLAYKNYAMQYENYQKQWDYTYNAKQYQVQDLEKAGLSKALANGSPVTPASASAPQMSGEGYNSAVRSQLESLSKLNLSEKIAMIRRINSDVSKTNAEKQVLKETAARERASRFNIEADTRDKDYNYGIWSERGRPFGEFEPELPRTVMWTVREIADFMGVDARTLASLLSYLFKRFRGSKGKPTIEQQYDALLGAAELLRHGDTSGLPAD